MGVLDKLKNFFYEEEAVEDKEEHEETLARKVEVPKNPKIDNKKFDETQEIKFNTELPKFEDEEEEVEVKKPEVKEKVETKVEVKNEPEEDRFSNFTGLFNDEDFEDQPEPELYDDNKHITYESPKKEIKKEEPHYQPPKKTYKTSYSFDGTSKKFIPSPIISPIYGILDTNYTKDDVKIQRVESYVAKSDIDTVRNKAYGYKEETTYTTNDEDDKPVDVKETVEVRVEVENHEEEPEEKETTREETNSKPTVKKVTLEDADEYYNDLGLAYNEDYNDGQREEYQSRHNRYDNKNDSENDNLFNLIDKMYNKED